MPDEEVKPVEDDEEYQDVLHIHCPHCLGPVTVSNLYQKDITIVTVIGNDVSAGVN